MVEVFTSAAAAGLFASLLLSTFAAVGTRDIVPGLAGLAGVTALALVADEEAVAVGVGAAVVRLPLEFEVTLPAALAVVGVDAAGDAVFDGDAVLPLVAAAGAFAPAPAPAPALASALTACFAPGVTSPFVVVAAGGALAGAAFAFAGISLAVAVTAPQGFGSTCAAVSALETSAAGVPVAALLPEGRSAASADIGRDSSAIYEAKDEGSNIF